MNSPDQILKHFGYTENWVRLGIVTPSELQKQITEFDASDDKNKEHYRCRAFLVFLDRVVSIPDELLEGILLLTDSGSDECDLAISRAFDLVDSGLLSDLQLHRLAKHPEYSDHQSFTLTIKRILLRRRLAVEGLTDRIFREVCELNDYGTLQSLLGRDDLDRDHVVWVAQHGCNKRLRNVATQMLQSRRFRNSG